MEKRGVEITLSPGYAYERAADQDHFLTRERTKRFFRDVFRKGDGGKAWTFTNSPLFLDFLAGNRTYECTPWSMPLRTVFGWQKPCYLIGDGYVQTFAELMEGTDWDQYGVGKYEKCSNCMTHCGFEGTAAAEAVRNPLKMFSVGRKGVRTDGPMAADVDLSRARPAEDVHAAQVARETVHGSAMVASRCSGWRSNREQWSVAIGAALSSGLAPAAVRSVRCARPCDPGARSRSPPSHRRAPDRA